MPPVDRLKPIRAASSESGYTLIEFMRDWPDDATCLEYLWRTRYAPDGKTAHCPKCDTERGFKRYQTKQRRQTWTCTGCGHHIHPTRRDDLREVVHVPALVVLRDLPHD